MTIEITAWVLLCCVLVCVVFMAIQERRHRRRTRDLSIQLQTSEDRVSSLTSLTNDIQASLRRRDDPPPEPWVNGLYRATQPLVIGGRRLEQGVMLFTSEHHVLDSVTVSQAHSSGSTAGNAIDRDIEVDRDLQWALRQGRLELVADAERVERSGGSMQQVFRGFNQSMERLADSVSLPVDRMFRDFDRSFAQLGHAVDRVDAIDLNQLWSTGRPPLTPADRTAKVAIRPKGPPPEPKRPSRYNRLVDDDELV